MKVRLYYFVLFFLYIRFASWSQCPAEIFNPSLSSIPVSCFGGNNGQVTLSFTSISPATLDFQLIDDITEAPIGNPIQSSTSPVVFNLTTIGVGISAGRYSVLLSYPGCDDPASVFRLPMFVDVRQPLSPSQGSYAAVCPGTSLRLTGNNPNPGGGIPASIGVWSISGPSVPTFSPNSNFHNATISGLISGTYQIVWTFSVSGCGSPYPLSSVVRTLVVNSSPQVTSMLSTSICSGVSQNYTITSNVSGSTFNWYRGVVSGITNGANSGSANVINESLVNPNPIPQTTFYSITATGPGPTLCPGISSVLTVTVYPTPSIFPTSASVCSGQAFTLTFSGLVSGTVFSWSIAEFGVSGATAGSSTLNPTILNQTLLGSGMATYSVTPSVPGFCTGTTLHIPVTVNGLPTITGILNSPICSGNATGIQVDVLPLNTQVNWSRPAVPGIIPASGYGAGQQIVEVLINTTNTTLTSTYLIESIHTLTGCVGLQTTVSQIVFPNPFVTSSGIGEVCSGDNFSYMIGTNILAVCRWYRLPNADISTPLPGTITGNVISENLLNTTSSTTQVFYVITPIASVSCSGTDFVLTVTVHPRPTFTGTNPSAICSGNSTSINLTSIPMGTAYTWTVSSIGVIGALNQFAPVYGPISQILTGSGTVQYTVFPILNGCAGNGVVLQQTVEPIPTLTIAGIDTVCPGASTSLTVTGANSYIWSPSMSLNTSTGNVVTATPTVNTLYEVLGTGANGCTAAGTRLVNLLSPPTVSISGSLALCIGQSTTLTASGVGASQYVWSPSTILNTTTGNTIIAFPTITSIVVTTAIGVNGCTQTTTSTIVVNDFPVLSLDGLGSICQGNSLIVTASGALNYAWFPGSMTGAVVSLAPISTTTYTVVGINGVGCSTMQTFTITVLGNPIVSISGSSSICVGQQSILTATGALHYVWQPALGLNTTTGTTVIASPTSSKTYQVVGSNIFGCTASGLFALTVNSLPITSVSGALNICSGQSFTVTGLGASNYVWLPDSVSGSTFNQTALSTTTYTVIGISAAQCVQNQSFTVSVTSTPTVTVSGVQSICPNTSFTLTATGASSFIWYPGSVSGAILTTSLSFNQTFTAIGINAGCAAAGLYIVTVHSTPLLTISGNSLLCEGQNTSLTAIGANFYYWSPAASLNTTTGNIVTANPLTNTTYTIVGVSSLGCTQTVTSGVTVQSLPSITVTSLNPVCQGTNTLLSVNGAVSYFWLPVSVASSSIVVSPSSSTLYTVIGTNAAGCQRAEMYLLTVNSIPNLTISGGGTFCAGAPITLTATGAANYRWMPGNVVGSVYSTASGSSFVVTLLGTSSGCSASLVQNISIIPQPNVLVSGSLTVCSNAGTSLSASGGSSYLWAPSNGLSTTTGIIVIASPAESTTYTLTGFVGICSANRIFTVTVNSLPNLSFVSNTTICNGSMVVLSTSGADVYTWAPLGSVLTINGNTALVNPTTTTIFTATGTSSITGCANSTTAEVYVSDLPLVSISGIPTHNFCTGNSISVTLTGAPSFNYGVSSIFGTITGAISGTGNHINHFLSGSGVVTYSIVGLDGLCSSALSTFTVTVNPNVSAPLYLGEGSGIPSPIPNSICRGLALSIFQTNSISQLNATALGWSLHPSIAGTISTDGYTQQIVTVNWNLGYQGLVTITASAFGCGASLQINTVIGIQPLPTITGVQIVQQPSGCTTSDGEVFVLALGQPTIEYSLDNGLNFQSNATFSGLSSGTYPTLVRDGNGCSATGSNFNLTLSGLPETPLIFSNTSSSFCEGAVFPVLTVTSSLSSVLRLHSGLPIQSSNMVSSTSGTLLIFNASTFAGTYTYYAVFEDINGCISTITSPVQYIIHPIPSAPSAYYASFCQYQSMSPLTASGSNVLWYVTSVGGVGSATAPTPVSSISGTQFYYVSQSPSGCESTRAVITVQINFTPSAPIISPNQQIYCQYASVAGINVSGIGIQWFTSSLGGISLGSVLLPNTSSVGTITYYVSQSNGICESSRTPFYTTILGIPAAPTITSPIFYCQNSIAAPLSATGVFVSWYNESVGGALLGTFVTPSTSSVGIFPFYAAQSISGCVSARSRLNVHVLSLPSPPIVLPEQSSYCQYSSTSLLTAIGSNITWFNQSVGGSNLGGILIPPSSLAGVFTFFAEDNNGICTSPRAKAVVTITDIPPVPTVQGPVSYCRFSSAQPLYASGTSLQWFDPLNNALGTTAIPSTTASGVFLYSVEAESNGCVSSRSQVQVTVNDIPTFLAAGISQGLSNCNASDAVLTIAALGSGLTYVLNFGHSFQSSPIFSGLSAGSYVPLVKNISGCTVAGSLINLTTSGTPDAPTFQNTEMFYCAPSQVSPLTISGSAGILALYEDMALSTPISIQPATNLIYNPASTSGIHTYWANLTVSGCASLSTAFTYTVLGISTPNVTSPLVFCQNTVPYPLTASGVGTLKWYTSSVGGVSQSYIVPSTSVVGITTYYVAQEINGCESQRVGIVISIVSLTPFSNCSPSIARQTLEMQTVCSGVTVSYPVSLSGASPFVVTLYNGSISTQQTITGMTGNLSFSGENIGISPILSTFTVTGVQDANGCNLNNSNVQFAFVIAPTPSLVIIQPEPVCAPSTLDLTLPARFAGSQNGQFLTFHSTFLQAQLGLSSLSGMNMVSISGNYFVRYASSEGCYTVGGISAIIQPIPEAILLTPQTICGGPTSVVQINSNGSGPWALQLTDGFSTFTYHSSSLPLQISNPPVGQFHLLSISSGICSSTLAGMFSVLDISDPRCTCSGDAFFIPTLASKCENTNNVLSLVASVSGVVSPFTLIVSQNGVSHLTFTGLNVGVGNLVSLTVNPNTTTTYAVSEIQSIGCSRIASGGSTTSVTVHPVPSLFILNTPTINCNQSAADITHVVDDSRALSGTYSFWRDASLINTEPTPTAVSILGTNYFVQKVTPNGCSASIPINVSYPDSCTGGCAANGILSAPDNQICIGESAALRLDLTGTAPWTVYISDGTQTSILGISVSPFFIQVQPTVNTTYSLEAIRDAVCSTSGTSMITISVSSTPPSLFVSGGGNICVGSYASIQCAFTGTAPYGIVYTDGFSVQSIFGINTSSYMLTVNPGSFTTYGFTSVVDTYCANSMNQSISVNPQNTLSSSVSLVTRSTLGCEGGIFTFTALGVNTGDAPVYTWYVNQNTAYSTSHAIQTFSALNQNDVVQVVMSVSGPNASCVTPSVVSSTGIAVSIAPIDFSVVPRRVSCVGGKDGMAIVVINNQRANLGRVFEFSLNGSAFSNSSELFSYTFSGLADSVFTISVRDSINPTCIQSQTFLGTGSIAFIPNVTPILPSCEGTDGGLIYQIQSSTEVVLPYYYTLTGLNFPSGFNFETLIGIDSTARGRFNDLVFGNYALYFGYNNCISLPIEIDMQGVPVPALSLGDAETVCKGETLTLTVPGFGSRFVWYVNDTLIPGVVSNAFTHTPNTQSKYTVSIVGLGNCTAVASKLINVAELELKNVSLQVENNQVAELKWASFGILNLPDSLVSIQRRKATPFLEPWENISNRSFRLGFFADSTVNLTSQRNEYRIFIVRNGLEVCQSAVHSLIWLRTNLDEANNKVDLAWNTYKNWKSGVSQYQLWINEDNQGWKLDRNLSPTDSMLILDQITKGFAIQYRIKALSNDPLPDTLSSWSNVSLVRFRREITVFSAFTPNGDGFNDYFTVKNIDAYKGAEVYIFNRWGQRVFYARDYANNWQAQGLPDGTYYYLIQLNNGSEPLKGYIEIVR